MTAFEIEEVTREEGSFIRSCKININGAKVLTPTRTVSVTKSNNLELKVASQLIDQKYRPFGEVYTRVSLDLLSQIKDDDAVGQQFSSAISNKLLSLKKEGAVPYLVLSIVDSNNAYHNQLLPDEVLNLIFDILWGTPGNSIIVPPLMGLLPNKDEYHKLIAALDARMKMSTERKDLPIMAPIPSSYNLIDPKLLEEYWNIGCRMFAFNCDNKKYVSVGYMIEKLHVELSELSKKSDDTYLLNAMNSRFKVGRKDSSRINNLLGTGFGFDIYSPNHITPKFNPNNQSDPNYYLFDSENYGFENLDEFVAGTSDKEHILDSNAFRNLNMDDVKDYTRSKKISLASSYNIEAAIKEIRSYSDYIQKDELHDYLKTKPRIEPEIKAIDKITHKTHNVAISNSLDAWF